MIDERVVRDLSNAFGIAPAAPSALARALETHLASLDTLWDMDVEGFEALTTATPGEDDG